MESKNRLTCFRCPSEILNCLDQLAEELGVSRSSLIVAAVKQLNKEVRRRKGRVVPPLSKGTRSELLFYSGDY